MTSDHIKLVQSSFERVVPISMTAADLFYGRLFELDPAARALFTGDMQEQKRKLMNMIAVVVKGLSRLDDIVPGIQALGVRHKEYHVTDAQYATVGAALLWTLEQGLGDAFTPEVREAWVEAYALLSATMIQAAHAA